MSATRLLSIDVGTQSARAIVFDESGNLIARAQTIFEPAYVSPHPGWAEQDPEVYWRGVTESCHKLWEQGSVKPEEIDGLALTTQRGTVICVDAQGHVLRPAILWLDQRLSLKNPALGPFYASVVRLAGAGDIIESFQTQAEANWIAQHEPEIWRKTSKFVFLSGWLLHRLSGSYVDSSAAQVGYVPFDFKNSRWEPRAGLKWRALVVRPDQLPRLLAPATPLGGLQLEAAAALGLKAGVPIVIAAADKACEVLGCGVLDPGIAQLSFGTTATVNVSTPKYVEVEKMRPPYPAAAPGRYTTEVQIFRGFWMISWFRREFAQREEALGAERGVAVESLFDELLNSVPAGSMGLTLQPYWSPSVRDPGPEAKGAIIGFGDVHTRAHLYRAIIEGLVYGLRAGATQIETKTKQPIASLRVAGGGSQSDVAMQITADIFGIPAERAHVYETSALGAAIDCAVGLGVHQGFPQAMRAMCRPGARFEPDAKTHATYDALYGEVYSQMYSRLRPLYEKIREITDYPPRST